MRLLGHRLQLELHSVLIVFLCVVAASERIEVPGVTWLQYVSISVSETSAGVARAEVLARATPRFPKDIRLARRLAELQYQRNDVELRRGTYRVRGEVIDIHPADSEREAIRVELFDEEIEN